MKLMYKYLILFFFIINCDSNNKKVVPITPFNVENLDNINVTSFNDKNLNSQGYNRIVVDMLVYEKSVKDTVVQLEIDMDYGTIRTKNWKIRLKNNDKQYLKDLIQKEYEVLSLDSYSVNDSINETYSFPAIRNSDNNIFLCHINKENDSYYLNITYYNSLKGKVLEKSTTKSE